MGGSFAVSKEYVLEHKQQGKHIHKGSDLLCLAGDGIKHHIRDDSKADALGDGVEQRHCDDGNVCGDGFAQIVIVESDLGYGADHQETDHDKCGCGGKRGDCGEYGGKQCAQQEEETRNECGKTGASAGTYTGCRLNKGGNGGGAQHSTHGGADCISEESRLDAGQVALFIQHIGLCRNADEGAESIEKVNKQKCKDNNHKVQRLDNGKVNAEALTEGLAQCGKISGDKLSGDKGVESGFRAWSINTTNLAEHTQQPGCDDADEDGALDIPDVQGCGNYGAHKCQQCAQTMGGEVIGKACDCYEGGGINCKTCVLKADKCNEQTNTHRYAALESQGNGVKDSLANIGKGKDYKNNAFDKYCQQRHLPAVAKAENNSIGQICVQTHTGRQDERQICRECHTAGANERSYSGCQQNGGGVHASVGKNAGVNGQNVCHGHEGGDAGHDFGFYPCAVLGKLEDFIQHFSVPFFE